MFEKKYIHGLGINCSDYQTALLETQKLLLDGHHHYICFIEANLFNLSRKMPALREVLNNADLAYPDGIVIQKILKYRCNVSTERVSGPTFMLEAAQYGIQHHWRHFFYGGANGVADELAQKLQKKYPGIEIAGTYSPPFRPLTEEEMVTVKQRIESARTDLLWVGLGGGKQDYWMHQNLGIINVHVMVGVGAAFDFHSGNRPWAPEFIRVIGFEWLFRLFSGGRITALRNIRCVSGVSFVLAQDFLYYCFGRWSK